MTDSDPIEPVANGSFAEANFPGVTVGTWQRKWVQRVSQVRSSEHVIECHDTRSFNHASRPASNTWLPMTSGPHSVMLAGGSRLMVPVCHT